MFKTIVVAMDGSENAARASSLASELARESGGKLVIAHVAEHNIGKGGGDLQVGQEELKDEIRKHADELKAGGLEVEVEIRDEMLGGPAHAIAEIAENAGADLIVVGTRGHSAIAGLLLGSVTQRLLHISACPVLSIPPQ